MVLVLIPAFFALACSGEQAQPTATPSPAAPASSAPASSETAAAVDPGDEPAPAPPGLAPLSVEEAFPNLAFKQMVDLTHSGDGTGRLFVVLREGLIHVFPNERDAAASEVFLDIRGIVLTSFGEEGLLGLAFAPDFAESGDFYVYYSASDPRRSVVARYTVDSATGKAPDPLVGVTILEVPQPLANHNGGQIAFGPDGYLYVALGDGGGAGDKQGHSQNPHTLLGTILRLDVGEGGATVGYRIPPDNPFAGGEAARPEVFAYGLRNPWRFAFDDETGLLWAADVGQNRYEEVNVVASGRNYGWNVAEGFSCFPDDVADCDLAGLEPPVIQYGRSDGCSVTGGRVYRGSRLTSLQGAYVYGDFCSGKIWGLLYDGAAVIEHALLADTGLRVSSFGAGPDGELYVLDYRERGSIYRLVEP